MAQPAVQCAESYLVLGVQWGFVRSHRVFPVARLPHQNTSPVSRCFRHVSYAAGAEKLSPEKTLQMFLGPIVDCNVDCSSGMHAWKPESTDHDATELAFQVSPLTGTLCPNTKWFKRLCDRSEWVS